ncbi:MAG: FadR family transcriptional regulator [Spirochaetales bacterium]|nr:FadR family transcriptional regulator [Spirochaetales bacterium]
MNEDLFAVNESRPTAVDIVIDKVKELLISKKLKPGELIPSESALAESLKVSRSSVREALKMLSAYGVVEIKRGAGTFISSASNKRMFDFSLFQLLVQENDYTSLTQVRGILEEGIVKLVIQFATDDELTVMQKKNNEFLAELSKPDVSSEKVSELDMQYHCLMSKYSHNNIMENIYNFVIGLFAPTMNPTHVVVPESHRLLQQAIEARDEEIAVEQVRSHIEIWKKTHESIIDKQ